MQQISRLKYRIQYKLISFDLAHDIGKEGIESNNTSLIIIIKYNYIIVISFKLMRNSNNYKYSCILLLF